MHLSFLANISKSKSFKQVNFAEIDDSADSQGAGGKDLTENPNETTNFKEYDKRTKNPTDSDYKQLKNSLDFLRELHGINIALDKNGQRKLILEVPLNEPNSHSMDRNKSKWNELPGTFDMAEKEEPIKRVHKYPIYKENIPGTFEKISIRNYSGPGNVSAEMKGKYSSEFSLDKIHEDRKTEKDTNVPQMAHSPYSNSRGGHSSRFSDEKDSVGGDVSFSSRESGKL